MTEETPLDKVRREMESLLGYPLGAFDPARNFFSDAERINRALGEGFKLMQEVIGPLQLMERLEALHPDEAILRIRKSAEDIFELPRKIGEIPPPWPDKRWRSD